MSRLFAPPSSRQQDAEPERPSRIGAPEPPAPQDEAARLQRALGNQQVGSLLGPGEDKEATARKVALDQRALRDRMRALLDVKPVDLPAVLKLITSVAPEVRHTLYSYPWIRMRIVSTFSGEDLVQVMSSILAGDTYTPGWQSEVYRTLGDRERALVDGWVNGTFKYKTGVTRELDPGNKAEMPLVRHWLRMRDDKIESDIGREIALEKEKARKEERFAEYLKEAVTKMNKVRFPGESELSALVVPPLLASDPRAEIKHWKLVKDKRLAAQFGRPHQGMLLYDGSATPATAVDELFKEKNLAAWALDCIEFVQVIHLYARRHTLGYTAFNKSIKESGGVLALRLQASTGYRTKLDYQRSSPSAPMEMKTPGGKGVEVTTDVDVLLDEAPVGSRVVWRNIQMKGTDFFNENTIKLGKDSFAAHGFSKKKVFTREELEDELARQSYEPAHGDFESYKKANVFLRKIEHVGLP